MGIVESSTLAFNSLQKNVFFSKKPLTNHHLVFANPIFLLVNKHQSVAKFQTNPISRQALLGRFRYTKKIYKFKSMTQFRQSATGFQRDATKLHA